MTTIDLADIAADSPYSYRELREAKRSGALRTAYAVLNTRQRYAVCAEIALATGVGLFEVQRRMARLLDEPMAANWGSRAA